MSDLTTDQVIDYFVEGFLHTHDGVDGDGREEIVRWHAAEIRRAKAEALRDAIDEIAGMGVEPWNRLTPAIKLLAARVNEIEETP